MSWTGYLDVHAPATIEAINEYDAREKLAAWLIARLQAHDVEFVAWEVPATGLGEGKSAQADGVQYVKATTSPKG